MNIQKIKLKNIGELFMSEMKLSQINDENLTDEQN